MKSIGIVGQGYVGGAVLNWFKTSLTEYDILVFDKFKKIGTLEEIDEKAEMVFVCVPTPYIPDVGYDDSAIVETLENLKTPKIIVIKSTILPGRAVEFKKMFARHTVYFVPEFLTARNADNDFINPSRQIIGFTEPNEIISKEIISVLPKAPFTRVVTSTEAELIKYFGNAFLATKVVFANQFYDLCQALGADYDVVKDCAAADERIGKSHLEIFHEGYRGYGGFCLPKDTKSIIDHAKVKGISMSLLKEVDASNDKIVSQNLQRPLVSVIITTCNRASLLTGAIRSVLSQKYPNIELIVVDDASHTDETKNVLASIGDSRLIVLRNPRNSGGAISLNAGISIAHGKYIAILDDDDEWIDENKLAAQVDFLESHSDHVMVGTQAIIVDSQTGEEISRSYVSSNDDVLRANLLLNNPILHSSVLFIHSYLRETGGYDISLQRGKDWDLILRLARDGKVAILGSPSIKYREPSAYDRDIIGLRLKDARAKLKVIWRHRNNYDMSNKALAVEAGRFSVFAFLKIMSLIIGREISKRMVKKAIDFKRKAGAK